MSALVTIDGQECTALVLTQPRNGRWTCSFAMQAETQPGEVSKVRFGPSDAQLELLGHIVTPYAAQFGIFVGRMNGGRGDVSKPAKPKNYRNTTIRGVLADLMSDAGEQLASDSDGSLLGGQLAMWSTLNRPVGSQIVRVLATQPGAVWRFLSSGDLWVGFDQFKAFGGDAQKMIRNPIEDSLEVNYADDSALVQPGQTFDGQRVGAIEHRVNENGMSGKLFFEAA